MPTNETLALPSSDRVADIVFVIKTKPHPRFERDGNNLVYTAEITLEQALAGFEIIVETLDGRQLKCREPGGIASSSYETVVRGEGMPSQRDRSQKGNLTVRCEETKNTPAFTVIHVLRREQRFYPPSADLVLLFDSNVNKTKKS